jgi:nicotinamidase-related amidase
MSRLWDQNPTLLKALIIIDMQAGSFNESPRHDAEGVIKRINTLSAAFRKDQHPVIIVQHDGTKEGCFYPGSAEWSIVDGLETDPTDERIEKTANDAFYDTELHHFLGTNGIREIVITGCATDFCVEATIQSALVKNYDVKVISNAHTTADRPYVPAEAVINHYNWVWQNMTPTGGKIEVIPLVDYLPRK